ncbi:MAG TPA: hypothetical protein VFA30_09810 [Gaiellaceae bacterium]|nr:hypothetical protein [Gaiellaceae bacterium]
MTRIYLAECYWPDVSEALLAEAAERVERAAARLRDDGADVGHLGTVLMAADEIVFCLFRGREQDVRELSLAAGLPFERVVGAEWLEPAAQ